VLLQRLTGRPLEKCLRELVFEPLGMRDTSFSVPPEKRARMTTLYQWKKDRPLKPIDGELWFAPPIFESGGGGLVSTVDDYAKFARIFIQNDGRVLSRKAVEAMCTDYLTPEQHAQPYGSFDRYDQDGSQMWTNRGFGYGLAVRTRRIGLGPGVGSVSWPGAYTTTWNADPREKLLHVLFTQVSAPNPMYSLLGEDYLNAVYQSL
jgi:CubicO group peptidase (beta-lactamase class C family)